MKSFKQYLSESDPNSWEPLPGYSYDEQDPNLRSDEEAEKTKEWYTYDSADEAPSKMRNGNTKIPSSEVDAEGRPTGRTIYQRVLSPENKAREEQKEIDRTTLEWDKERTQIIRRQKAEAEAEAEAKARSLQAPLPSPLRTKKYEEPTEAPPPRPWRPPMDTLG